jgi:hypothetical protein
LTCRSKDNQKVATLIGVGGPTPDDSQSRGGFARHEPSDILAGVMTGMALKSARTG